MGLVRFGVSLDKELLVQFDKHCAGRKYANRSEAIRDLIRDNLVKEQWADSRGEVSGVISLVYDHHKRELVDYLLNIQHDHQNTIIASQHVHLDHDNCLEVIIVKGVAAEIVKLAAHLRSMKGVKHGELVMTTTGKAIR
jgi:CopG family nickel-responsive transcriptional regulator